MRHDRSRFHNGLFAGLLVVCFGAASGLAQGPQVRGKWDPIPLLYPRKFSQAVGLPDGRVLIIGGTAFGQRPTSTSEIFDPATMQFTAGPPVTDLTLWSTVAAIPAGALIAPGRKLSVARVFDASSGELADVGTMVIPRQGPDLLPLADGTLLLISGGGTGHLVDAEIYRPVTRSFAPTGAMLVKRIGCPAITLADGRVLAAGGTSGEEATYNQRVTGAELYDPRVGRFASTGSLEHARAGHTLTQLADGRVLIAGGVTDNGYLASAELYDPATGTFRATGPMREARSAHTATRLADGRVLVTGGHAFQRGRDVVLSSVELFDPATEAF